MSAKKTTTLAGADLADEELIAFARAALGASPVAALSALRHMVVDGAASLKELGVGQATLERLCLRSAKGGRDDWEAVDELARAVIHGGSEELSLAMSKAVSLAVAGSAAGRSKWERAPTVDLDFMDARAVMELPAAAARAWVECAPLLILSEDAVGAIESRPEHFEGEGGVERVKEALKRASDARGRGGFWLSLGPNALAGALSRCVEDQADEDLMEACSAIMERVEEDPALDPELARGRLCALAKALGDGKIAERDPELALEFLASASLHGHWEAVESFARAADWAGRAPSFSQLPSGLRAPHERIISHIKPHRLIEQSEANEAPLGLRELALLWDEPELDAIGEALGEAGDQARRLAEAIERYEQAEKLARDDPEAGAALAQSAGLLWESHKGELAAPERPTPRI